MRAKGSGQSVLLLLDVIDILLKEKIPYAIIGAFAASFYGVIRASMDADAVISLTSSPFKAQDLTRIFNKSGLCSHYRQGGNDDPLEGVIKIEDAHNNQVDLITGIRGMADDVFERVTFITFLKHKICVIGVEDFIAMKIFAGSFKDIDDARKTLQVSRKITNFSLLKQLTKGYGKKEIKVLESLLNE